MKIRIGKSSGNDFVVPHDSVSRNHACLMKEDGEWILEDLSSTNGTWVNEGQILRKKITRTDKIRFGESDLFCLEDLLKSPDDYSKEFQALKKIYDEYINEKIKIQSSNQFKTRLFQSLPFACIGLIGLFMTWMGKGNSVLWVISLIVAICAPTLGIYLGARQAAKTPRMLQDLVNRFKISYVCPKCGTFLGEIPWESLHNKGECMMPSCRARWVKE